MLKNRGGQWASEAQSRRSSIKDVTVEIADIYLPELLRLFLRSLTSPGIRNIN